MHRRLRTILHLLEQRKLTELQLEFDAILLEDHSEEVKYLYHLFRQKLFTELTHEIQDVLQKTQHIVPSDINIQGIKTQIRILETQLSVVQYKKTEILKEIDRFRIRHNSDLGWLIGKILKIQMEIFYLLQDVDSSYQANYQEAKKDYTAYQHQRRSLEKIQPLQILDEKQRESMKKMYREASKLCHPDIVNDDFREEARKVFIELNRAYMINDIQKVEEIHKLLTRSRMFSRLRTPSEERELLEARLARLQADLKILQSEIRELEESQVYHTLMNIRDWDEYFEQTKMKLNAEYQFLKTEHEQLRKVRTEKK
ncbi:MAG TPA: hypothetical protein PK028_00775 [Bacteroidales bacterium]|jgi:hypothetical protein|nr:hypothetical protein [Bacteroidales bacterium]MDI9573039.1 hypothetical protein [Bacteroidota bacterium]OQC62061.1 MAG: DnaJ domain protein [Bacteroidetes bacterium ADurb.Bin012]MBP9511611.1 hypothetical protein [Bacteroidales bacterium]MBP9588087.1 hypothetical protein [Bacteroidales bacterium]